MDSKEPAAEPPDDTKPYIPSPRRQKHLAFQKWRYERGEMRGDDYPEALTDEEKDRLARHVLP